VTVSPHRAAAFMLAAAIVPAASAEIGSTLDLLPPNSVVVMHGTEAAPTMQKLRATPLMSFMERDDVKAQMDELMSEMSAGLSEALEEDDVDPMSLLPDGGMAISLFPAFSGTARTALPGIAVAGDWGEGAERMWERIGTILEADEMSEEAVVEQVRIAGRTVWRIETIVEVDAQPGMDDMGGMGGMGGMGMFDPEQMLGDAFGRMWVAREGSHIVITSHEETVRRMFDVADDVDVERLAERDDVRALGDRIGTRDVNMMLLMRDMPAMLSGVDQMGMLAVVTPILQQYFGRITGVASGLTVSSEDAMIDTRTFVHMPDGKAGFTALMDSPAATLEVPAFVPADAAAYSQYTFEFSGLAPLIGRMARTAAMMGAPLGEPETVQQIEQIVTQFTDTLGDTIHQVQVVQRPISATNTYQLMTIECPDTQGMDQFLSMFGAQAGLEGRDFAGERLYSMDPAGMAMMAGGMPMGEQPRIGVGLGGGQAFFGTEVGVESMLRAVGDPGAASLGDEPAMQRGMRVLEGMDLVAWGWADMPTTLEASIEQQKRSMEQMMEMMGEMDPAMREEMMAGMGPMAMMMDMDADMFRSLMGDTVFAVRSTEDGFVMDQWLFAPAGE